MAQFFLILISVGVMALLLVAGSNYLQPSANLRIEMRDKTTAALQAMSSAYRAYKISNRAAPATASWATLLVPYYTEKWSPGRLTYNDLTYANDATYGYYFCYTSTTITSAEHAGLLEVPAQFPVDTSVIPNQYTVVISYNACGKRSTDALGSAPSSWPGTVYVTFWLDYANAI